METASSTMAAKAPSSTRLMITKMILENFKSYAGVQEIGPFHKRFSSIVGPNGSGKSNVIDALLFVFAKKASQLRLKKVSELIHKSSGFPNLQYAQVSVYFQLINDDESSEDDYEVVPGSEFVISRVACSDNTSKYTINAKNSTATEVKKMLDSYGIDLDNNRFLILQGEVEQIAMMKPKAMTPNEDGLLEYLEDIIGSNRFVERIEEVSKSLDTINDQRLDRVNRLKIAERDRDNLSGSKAEAENFLEKERDIRRKQNILYQAIENIAGKNVIDFQQRVNTLQEKMIKEKSKRADHEAKLKEMEKEYNYAHKEYNEVDSELQRATSDFAAFERRDVKLQEDMKHNHAQFKKSQTSFSKESKKESESMSEASRLSTQLEAGRRSVEDITAKKVEEEAKIEEIMASLQDATKSLRERLEVAQVHLAEAERRTATFQSEKEVVNTRIQLLKSRAGAAASGVLSIQQKLHELEQERATSENRIRELEMEGKELEKSIAAAEKQRVTLHERETAIQGNLRQAREDVEDVKSRFANQGKNGAGGVVDAIMKACGSKGPLARAGVHGRLGDLASIDPEFDIAISTACGMLDNIVVETTEGAQACLSFLKDNNLGRATFILLDQMNEWKARMATAFRAPTGTYRLFDVISSSKEAYLPAFYMALKDTLVANDLDSATAIAYVGDRAVHRVVTRTGDLIDTSGAMSGGGKAVKSGAMKLKSGSSTTSRRVNQASEDDITPEIIKSYEDKVEQLQAALQQCRQDREQNEVSMKDMKTRSKSRITDVDKQRALLSSLSEQMTEYHNRLQRIAAETQLTGEEQHEIIELEKQLQRLDVDMTRAAPDLRSHKLEVSNIQQQIRDVGGPRLGKAQARLDLLSTQYDKLTKELSSTEVEESNHRKQAVKAQASREKFEKEVMKFEAKIAELLKEQQDMEHDALLVAEAVQAATAKMINHEKQLNTIKVKFDEIKVAVKRIEEVEVDIQNEVDKSNKDLNEHKSTAQAWRKKLDAVRKAHVEEQREFQSNIETAIGSLLTSSSTSTAAMKEIAGKDVEILPDLTEDQLDRAVNDVDDLKKEISILEAEKQKLESSVNMNDLIEYLKKDAQYRIRVAELETITEERNVIRKEYEEIRRQRLEEFMTGFGIISLKLKEMYQMITLGGDAELELVDSLDPFSEGIVFTVRPKNKSWKNISNLSGGEKTLSSLALVFALHHYKPTPLYVMDEIDAALDFKNVSIVANYIKDRTKNAQFVIISLRNNMFELADRLVGIYKTHDATKSVTINPKLISAEAMKGENSDENVSDAHTVAPAEPTAKSSGIVKPHGRRALADATNIKA